MRTLILAATAAIAIAASLQQADAWFRGGGGGFHGGYGGGYHGGSSWSHTAGGGVEHTGDAGGFEHSTAIGPNGAAHTSDAGGFEHGTAAGPDGVAHASDAGGYYHGSAANSYGAYHGSTYGGYYHGTTTNGYGAYHTGAYGDYYHQPAVVGSYGATCWACGGAGWGAAAVAGAAVGAAATTAAVATAAANTAAANAAAVNAAAAAANAIYMRIPTDIPDGLSTTIAVGETIPWWCRVNYGIGWLSGYANVAITQTPINYNTSCTEPKFSWGCTQCTAEGMGAQSYMGYTTCTGFKSFHPGGCNFVMCDGSVTFISQNINQTLFQYLGCRYDGQVASLP